MSLKNETLKASKQQGITREYTHISAMLYLQSNYM